MQKSSIKESLARNGERATVVRVVENGVDVEHSQHSTRGAAAGRYVELVDEYGGTADA